MNVSVQVAALAALRAILRIGVAGFGLLIVSIALACLLLPDTIYSDDHDRPARAIEVLLSLGTLGQGLLLLLSPRWLAQPLPTFVVLLVDTLTMIGVMTWRAEWTSLRVLALFVAVITLQCVFVAKARRDLGRASP